MELLLRSNVCLNPHAESQRPGNVFPFTLSKILGSGRPVVSTRMGHVEADLQSAILFSVDHSISAFRAAMNSMIMKLGEFQKKAEAVRLVVNERYGSEGLHMGLETVLSRATRVPWAQPGEE